MQIIPITFWSVPAESWYQSLQGKHNVVDETMISSHREEIQQDQL